MENPYRTPEAQGPAVRSRRRFRVVGIVVAVVVALAVLGLLMGWISPASPAEAAGPR